ncbi:glutaredoxin family protein [Salinibius halmophilus]|uniref:glutaredoxin family protein n=1 Tax=Salinibius halmophilus TaxID=1853216 RepID=UPI000E665B46|nr:glutaredoxin family protein [Salinibius halmophilus]
MRKLWLILATILTFSACAGAPASDRENLMVTSSAVELYATSWCGYCARTRAFFEENNIDYVEFDIEQDANALDRFKQMGGQGVPLTVINNHIVYGYNLPEIERQLDI